VNFTQIHLAVPEIFEAQTKKSQMALKTEPYLCVVMTGVTVQALQSQGKESDMRQVFHQPTCTKSTVFYEEIIIIQ